MTTNPLRNTEMTNDEQTLIRMAQALESSKPYLAGLTEMVRERIARDRPDHGDGAPGPDQ